MLDFAARPLYIGFRVSVRGDRMADYYVDFLFSIAAQFHSCRLVILDLCWRSDWLAAGRTNRCFSVALMLPRRGGDTMKLTIRSAAQLALPALRPHPEVHQAWQRQLGIAHCCAQEC